MFNKIFVYEALKSSNILIPGKKMHSGDPSIGQDTLISLLIHDIFGAEILKSRTKKNWHFYNRIDGEIVDFTMTETQKGPTDLKYEDIPSTPDETYDYVDQNDYSTFLLTFVRAFEEAVGLENRDYGLAN